MSKHSKSSNKFLKKITVNKLSKPKVTDTTKIEETFKTRFRLKCKNKKQKEFINLINDYEIVMASGPAGVGKSYLAIGKALELLRKTDNSYKNMVICKPAVESGENLGFIPGTLDDKMAPHIESSLDIVDKMIGKFNRIKMVEEGQIKVVALGFLRGKTIDNTIFIMEEAQNMSPNQVKTLLTRIGENSKFIISGDLNQSDKYSDVRKTGLYDIMTRHKNIKEIGFFEFNIDDIVRNPIISKILRNYDNISINKPLKFETPIVKKLKSESKNTKPKLTILDTIKKIFIK